MKRCRGLVVLGLLTALCAGAVWLTLRVTARYPAWGEPVTYPVNRVEGFALSIEETTWSPFRGYTLRYEIQMDSEEIYHLVEDGSAFAYLERLADGQWYRLDCQREQAGHSTFDLGGSGSAAFYGSVVQKYEGYGTRLEPGTYRLTMKLTDRIGGAHYLAAEFDVA